MTKKELKDTYIRYDSSITDVICNKIIKIAEDLGFTQYGISSNFTGLRNFGYLNFTDDYYIQSAYGASGTFINPKDILSIPKETNLEKAQRLYPVGTRYKALNREGDIVGETAIIDCAINELSVGLEGGVGYVYIIENDTWAEIVEDVVKKEEPPMTEEDDLLRKANEDYPVGTTFRVAHLNSGAEATRIEGESFLFEGTNTAVITTRTNQENGYTKLVYYYGKWAEILSKPKQEFISGKWYKNEKGYYGKCIKFDHSRDKFTASGYKVDNCIDLDTNYSFCSGYTWTLLEDLSEIQSFLPDDHSDKIVDNLIFGEYKVGDIVVSEVENGYRSIGQMLEILEPFRESSKNKLHFASSSGKKNSETKGQWRAATINERSAYNRGVRNINNITKGISAVVDKPKRIFQVGEIVMLSDSQLPITDNWLGEGGNITHQGPYTVTDVMNGGTVVIGLDNINCTLSGSRFSPKVVEVNTGIRGQMGYVSSHVALSYSDNLRKMYLDGSEMVNTSVQRKNDFLHLDINPPWWPLTPFGVDTFKTPELKVKILPTKKVKVYK